VKTQPQWQGQSILDSKHSKDLELSSAINEFHHGMSRQDAERKALDDYRSEHHARAAAHHLAGMNAAQAIGSPDDGKRHYEMYRLHIRALGHEPHEAVPPEVKQHLQGDSPDRVYRFKAHGADQFLVSPTLGGK
jgi:hypothetical protein